MEQVGCLGGPTIYTYRPIYIHSLWSSCDYTTDATAVWGMSTMEAVPPIEAEAEASEAEAVSGELVMIRLRITGSETTTTDRGPIT